MAASVSALLCGFFSLDSWQHKGKVFWKELIALSFHRMLQTLKKEAHRLYAMGARIGFQKTAAHLSRILFLKFYRLSFHVGKQVFSLADALSSALHEFWYLTLQELFERGVKLLKRASGLKMTRAGRGDISVANAVSSLFSGLRDNATQARGALESEGAVGAAMVFHQANSLSCRLFWNKYKGIFNYLAPAMGVLVLALCVSFWTSVSFALDVGYNGKTVGSVKDAQTLDDAAAQVETSVASATGQSYELNYTPTFILHITDKKKLDNADSIAGKIVSASASQLKTGYGLYVDGSLVAVNDSESSVRSVLDGLLGSYKSNTPGETVAFVQQTEIKKGLFPVKELKTPDEIKTALTSPVTKRQVYTAQKGDSPARVASRFNMPLDTLVTLNPAIAGASKVSQGQTLVVDSAQNLLTVKLIRNEYSVRDIPYGKQTVQNSSLYEGITQVKSPGANGKMLVATEVTYIDGAAVGKRDVASQVTQQPVNEVDYVGTKPKPSTKATGNLMWPIPGGIGYVSCPYGGYRGHSGMDIACNEGTPIMAADGGTVVFAGWDSSYGNCVIIDHHNGFQTLYGHSSRLLIKQGQSVFKGQVIALVGHTGHVVGRTGNHLHFQLQTSGGTTFNPAKYLPPR